MDGWLKLHRSLMSHPLWTAERFTKGQAWVDILGHANYTSATIFIHGVALELNPGEQARSIVTLAEKWGWNRRTVDNFLSLLEKWQMIHTKKSELTTVITIQNWSEYQEVRSKVHTNMHSTLHTVKKEKNYKNKNSNSSSEKSEQTVDKKHIREKLDEVRKTLAKSKTT